MEQLQELKDILIIGVVAFGLLTLAVILLTRRPYSKVIRKGRRCTLRFDGITARVFLANTWKDFGNRMSYQLVFGINGRGVNLVEQSTRINSGGNAAVIYPRSWDTGKWRWQLTGEKVGKNKLRVTLSKKPR